MRLRIFSVIAALMLISIACASPAAAAQEWALSTSSGTFRFSGNLTYASKYKLNWNGVVNNESCSGFRGAVGYLIVHRTNGTSFEKNLMSEDCGRLARSGSIASSTPIDYVVPKLCETYESVPCAARDLGTRKTNPYTN